MEKKKRGRRVTKCKTNAVKYVSYETTFENRKLPHHMQRKLIDRF